MNCTVTFMVADHTSYNSRHRSDRQNPVSCSIRTHPNRWPLIVQRTESGRVTAGDLPRDLRAGRRRPIHPQTAAMQTVVWFQSTCTDRLNSTACRPTQHIITYRPSVCSLVTIPSRTHRHCSRSYRHAEPRRQPPQLAQEQEAQLPAMVTNNRVP